MRKTLYYQYFLLHNQYYAATIGDRR